MQAMIFGAKSSPTSANYCLKKTAIDNKATCSEEAVSTVLRDFYMDDLLKSLPSEDEAAQLALQLIELLSRGGCRLTKFMSNSRNVLAQLLPKDILGSPGISQPFDLDLWNVEQDKSSSKAVSPNEVRHSKADINHLRSPWIGSTICTEG